MTEKQLIRHFKELAEIKPSKNWVSFTKKRIFKEEPETESMPGLVSFFPFFRYKVALAPIVSVLVVIGLFGFAYNTTVPGDVLFSVKKITETAQVTFSSVTEKPKASLKLANKRLEELNKIAENNQIKNLDPTIKEFQANIAQAAKDLTEMNINVTSSDPIVIKELVAESQKIEENKEKVEAVLGTVVGDTTELTNAITLLEKQIATYLLADLSQRTLREQDQALLAEAQQDFAVGNYSQALEKIWLLSNNNH